MDEKQELPDRWSPILLAVWRAACRHIEINQAVSGIFQVLEQQVPIRQLVVHRVEPEHALLARVAIAPSGNGDELAAIHLNRPVFEQLMNWVGKGEATHLSDRKQAPRFFTHLVSDIPGCCFLVPLPSRSHVSGAMTIRLDERSVDFRDQCELLAMLQEPMTVALENDRRQHEMAALREAAEAEARSLLRRLGRKEIHDRIVGERSGLASIMRRVSLVAPSDAPVLLLGETGTGKEVIARAIHLSSGRHQGPFIRVNCGAIPSELIDSQLFGHEKGSFTGASETRMGWFERADGGTLFLDEIGELPIKAQVRFLRVLQDSLIERVGGTEAIRVDVRVVAATHRDLQQMFRQGGFREDLWYRIAVFPITLPPLRERLEDIPELTRHFAERAARRFVLPLVEPTDEDFELLRGYPWPGNIRELGSVIDRAVILGEGHSLEVAAALGLTSRIPQPAAVNTIPVPAMYGPPAVLMTLDEVMKRHIESTLRETRGKVEGPAGAAERLGINPHTLRARMRKLGIHWNQFKVPFGLSPKS